MQHFNNIIIVQFWRFVTLWLEPGFVIMRNRNYKSFITFYNKILKTNINWPSCVHAFECCTCCDVHKQYTICILIYSSLLLYPYKYHVQLLFLRKNRCDRKTKQKLQLVNALGRILITKIHSLYIVLFGHWHSSISCIYAHKHIIARLRKLYSEGALRWRIWYVKMTRISFTGVS